MPAELTALIAKNCDAADLKALRLVSRNLWSKTEDHFLSTFFAERTHVYTPDSLKALVAITNNKGLLRKLKRVEFVVWHF